MKFLPDQPLTDAEWNELDEFLNSDDSPDNCMDISMLDGFFVALAIRPDLLMPSQWLPAVWGGEERVFQDLAQAERIHSLLMRYYNEVVGWLREAPEEFMPAFYERKLEDKTIQIIDEWCMGFIQGLKLHNPAWKTWLQDEVIRKALTPFLLFGTEAGWDELKQSGKEVELHAEAVETIRPLLLILSRELKAPRRTAAKPGRNDLCSCGSGKKYKRCCGLN